VSIESKSKFFFAVKLEQSE